MGRLSHIHKEHAAAPAVVKAKSADVAAIVELNKQFHKPLRGFVWDTPGWIAGEIAEGNYYVIRDAQGVAAAMCLPVGRHDADIHTMAVRADLHGQGLGKVLVDHAIDLCRKAGVRELSVMSYCSYGVKGFYEGCGFNCSGTRGRGDSEYYCFSMDIDAPEAAAAPRGPERAPSHG